VSGLSPRKLSELTNSLRSIVTDLEAKPGTIVPGAETAETSEVDDQAEALARLTDA
jgi:hypothetical protein